LRLSHDQVPSAFAQIFYPEFDSVLEPKIKGGTVKEGLLGQGKMGINVSVT